MKIELLNPHLAYVSIGSPRIHARLVESTYTFCGRSIEPGVESLPEREIDADWLCGRCYRSLRTYGETSVRLNRKEVVS